VLALLLLLGAAGTLAVHHLVQTTSGGATAIATAPAGGQMPTVIETVPAPETGSLLGWFAQRGAPDRRIAGIVTDGERPLPGIEVQLGGMALAARGAVVTVRTDGHGRFDFGPQVAATYTVFAGGPQRALASVPVDLRDPTRVPAPDDLLLVLHECRDRIVGHVVDAAGTPLPGATATIDARWGERGPAVVSDQTGHFEMCLPWTSVQLQVGAAGYGTLALAVDVRGDTPVDVMLTPAASIRGQVVLRGSNDPVPHVMVAANPSDGGLVRVSPRLTMTDANGRFRLDDLASGAYTLFANGDGLATVQFGEVVTEAGGESEVRIVVEPRVRLAGRVLAGGQPVAGARVQVRGADGGLGGGETARSQADGSFVLSRAPSARLEILVDGAPPIRPLSVVAPPTGLTGVDIEVAPRATLRGRVTMNGMPVVDAEVMAVGAEELARVRTSVSGEYEISGLPAGEVTVWAKSERLRAFAPGRKVTLSAQHVVEARLILDHQARLAGRVVDDTGGAVAGALVIAHGGGETGVDRSGPDGRFNCDMLGGGGLYHFSVSLRGVPLKAASAFPVVALNEPTETHDNIELRVVAPKATISGRVVHGDGSGAPDATVSVVPEGDTAFLRFADTPRTISDSDGRFELDGLPSGMYTLQAATPAGAQAVVRGVASGSKDVSITVPAPGALDVTLVGFAHTPEVVARHTQLGILVRGAGDEAHGRLSGMAAGTWRVGARNGLQAATAMVTLREGETQSITLEAQDGREVPGQVVELDGRPASGFSCWAMALGSDTGPIWGGTSGQRVQADAAGKFALHDVPAGSAVVVCDSDDGRHSDGAVVVAEADLRVVVMPTVSPAHAVGFRFGWLDRLSHRVIAVSDPASDVAVGDVVVSVAGQDVRMLTSGGVSWLLAAASWPVEAGVIRNGSLRRVTLR
jgi:hypothetical protein